MLATSTFSSIALKHPRFWSKVKIGNPWECWPWLAGRFYDDYGEFWWNGKHVRAHQFAFAAFHKGRWAKPLALHECDNKPCCNPFHIFEGSYLDNINQAIERNHRPGAHMHSRLLKDKP